MVGSLSGGRHTRSILVAAGLMIALVIGNVVATRAYLTEPHPGHNDFMSRWEGVRSFWRDGLNPYGEQASANIQDRIYGRPAAEDEDPGYFAYPFYTVFLLWPLAYVDYAWASALWMVVLEACLIGTLVLLLDLVRWRPRPWLLAALLLWMLINYFSARGLILGQPGLAVVFLEVLALWALSKDRSQLAGGALALSTLKPQMGFLLAPFLLLWGSRSGRRAFVASFVIVWGALMALSFIAEPSWFSDWIDQIRRYPSYTAIGAPTWIVMQHYLGAGDAGEWAVNGILYAAMLWAWAGVLVQRREQRLMWTVVLTLTITHLCAVRTATPHYVVFTLPLIFYCKRWAVQRRSGGAWIVILLIMLFVVPWVHFLLTVEGEFEHPTLYLPVLFTVLAVVWLTRREWWRAGPILSRHADTAGTT
ncbi:MAG: DUF2029 domain-containing protein [Chloroflexi bacterium]|nr:DUF2029 domain-containing protein [Chloroflexota bacterium]